MKKMLYFLKKNLQFIIFFFKGGSAAARFAGVSVGDGCRIYTATFGSEPFLISIGNNVTITSGIRFITHDGSGWLMRDEKGRRFLYAPIRIGNNIFIGPDSIIMPGVIIEDNVVVAPGSVITKSIPSNSVVAGVPAKIIGKYEDLEKKMLLHYKSNFDIDPNLKYKDRVLKLLTKTAKPFLEKK